MVNMLGDEFRISTTTQSKISCSSLDLMVGNSSFYDGVGFIQVVLIYVLTKLRSEVSFYQSSKTVFAKINLIQTREEAKNWFELG